MSKELVISATPHETRVAILEDGHLCEIYIEREKEFALVGSIYKGRVTRVLPGMQSAFVDIGRDTDAFLYVSDFLENLEEYDHVPAEEAKPAAQGNGHAAPAASIGEEVSIAADSATGLPVESSETTVESEAGMTAQPADQTAAPAHSAEPAIGLLPGESFGTAAGASSEFAPRSHESSFGGHRSSGRPDRGGRDRDFGGGHGRGGRDRGGRSGGRFRRAGGRGRGDRPRGHDLPSSKYASPSGQHAHSSHSHHDRSGESGSPAEELPPILLPGESLAKFKTQTTEAANVSHVGEIDAEPPAKLGGASSSTEPAYPVAQTPESTPVLPDSLYMHHEHSAEHHDPADAEQAAAMHEDDLDDAAEAHLDANEEDDARDEEAAEVQPAQGFAADLTDDQARTLSASLVEAKHEATVEEVDETVAHPIGGADFAEAEADASHHDDAEEEESDEENGDSTEQAHEDAADLAHEEAHAAMEQENSGGMHAASEATIADTSEPQPPGLTNASNEQRFYREPRSARVDDRRSARFQRPMRRGGRGGRPMRHGRPQERHHGHGGGHAPQRRPQLISEMLKAGQEIIVQIAKEPLGKKGARITSHVALPGRFLVYMPTVNHIGVSRKISSAEARARLRGIVGEYKSTFPGGFIVRTAASNVSDQDLRNDIEFLGKTWHEICARSEQRKAPSLLHRDLNLVERILRDYVSSDYTSIWIDNEEEFGKVVEFVSRFQPDLVNRVKLYTKEAPIFEEFGIQQELDKAMRPKVWLKSGGYIVINHTEALVAIDVNTGKFVGRGSTRLEDTIVKTNLEAVKEIVRQIRLRDLGGIIIVDFIDMEERRNRDKVLHAVDDELRADKAPSKVLPFNEFGLVAITRKRTKQALEKVLCQPCPYCTGSGMVKSIPTICFEIQMEAKKMAEDLDSASITLRVHPEIAKALKTRESGLIEELEGITHKSVIIQADPTLHWEQYDIY